MDAVLEAAMPTEEVATPQLVASKVSQKLANNEVDQHKRAEDLRNQEKKPVSLAPQYRPYFGNTMVIGLSGINVYVPCDGRTYHIPKDFAAVLHERRRRVDDFLMRKQRMANVQANFETYPGELQLF
jgi:hypothetical protein